MWSSRYDIPEAATLRLEELANEEDLMRRSVAAQSGTSIPQLFTQAESFIVNPANVGTGTLARMIATDDTVSTAFEFKNLMILAKIGDYHHDKSEIADFVNAYLKGLKRPTWQATQEGILSATGYGFSVSEIVFGLNKKLQKVPFRIPTYHPSMLAFETDQYGQVTPMGILQFVMQNGQFANPNNWMVRINSGFEVKNPFTTPQDRLHPYRVPFVNQYGLVRIPRNKVIHHVNKAGQSFGNPYGSTAVRTAHLAWQLKIFFMRQMGIAAKRASTPLIWATAPHGSANVEITDEHGRKKKVSPVDALRELLADRETDDSVVTGPEGANGSGYKLTVLDNTANLEQMKDVIDNLDVRIFRCFLLPSLVMTDGSAGSRSLGDKHFQIVDHLTGIEADRLGESIVNDLIERTIIENFGEQEDYGHFQRRPQSVEELERLASMFTGLVSGQILKPYVKSDMAYMRKQLSLPEDTDTSFDLDPKTPLPGQGGPGEDGDDEDGGFGGSKSDIAGDAATGDEEDEETEDAQA